MDGDPDLEGTMWAYYEKHFTKLATKKLQEQLNYMKTPLISMQKDIDKMTNAYNKATSAKEMKKLFKEAGELIGALNRIDFGASRGLSNMLGRYTNFDSVINTIGTLDVVSKSAQKLT